VFTPLVILKVEQEFIWKDQHQEAFDQIKRYLMEPLTYNPCCPKENLKPLKLEVLSLSTISEKDHEAVKIEVRSRDFIRDTIRHNRDGYPIDKS